MHMHHGCVCGGQRTASGGSPHLPPCVSRIFGLWSFAAAWAGLADQTSWPDNQLPGPLLSLPPFPPWKHQDYTHTQSILKYMTPAEWHMEEQITILLNKATKGPRSLSSTCTATRHTIRTEPTIPLVLGAQHLLQGHMSKRFAMMCMFCVCRNQTKLENRKSLDTGHK